MPIFVLSKKPPKTPHGHLTEQGKVLYPDTKTGAAGEQVSIVKTTIKTSQYRQDLLTSKES
jgi:hypothetical protein